MNEWAYTGPCNATLSDLLCIPSLSPPTVIHFEQSAVRCIKGHLASQVGLLINYNTKRRPVWRQFSKDFRH
jgi:hypothetical protein